jgi:hypothetical protein
MPAATASEAPRPQRVGGAHDHPEHPDHHRGLEAELGQVEDQLDRALPPGEPEGEGAAGELGGEDEGRWRKKTASTSGISLIEKEWASRRNLMWTTVISAR